MAINNNQAKTASQRGKRLQGATHKNGPIPTAPMIFREKAKKHHTRYANVTHSWLFGGANKIRAIVEHSANHPVKTLADMTPEQRAEIEARYGAKIKV